MIQTTNIHLTKTKYNISMSVIVCAENRLKPNHSNWLQSEMHTVYFRETIFLFMGHGFNYTDQINEWMNGSSTAASTLCTRDSFPTSS